MEDVRSRLDPKEHCTECGALLNGQAACGNCGSEVEGLEPVAAIIHLGSFAGGGTVVTGPWSEDQQVA